MYLIKLLDTYSKLFNSRIKSFTIDMSQLLVLGKLESGGGPIFKVVLEC